VSNIISADPFSDYTVIGRMTTEEKARLLRELGDDTIANELLASLPAAHTKSLFGGGLGRSR
jgi:hypothetical protein